MLQTTPFSPAAAFSVTCKEGDLGPSSVGRECCHDMHPGCSQASTFYVCRTQPLPQLINKFKGAICCCVETCTQQCFCL